MDSRGCPRQNGIEKEESKGWRRLLWAHYLLPWFRRLLCLNEWIILWVCQWSPRRSKWLWKLRVYGQFSRSYSGGPGRHDCDAGDVARLQRYNQSDFLGPNQSTLIRVSHACLGGVQSRQNVALLNFTASLWLSGSSIRRQSIVWFTFGLLQQWIHPINFNPRHPWRRLQQNWNSTRPRNSQADSSPHRWELMVKRRIDSRMSSIVIN